MRDRHSDDPPCGHGVEAGERPDSVVMLRPVANPLPLSFLGLALASATFAAVELGWVPPGQERVAALVALLVALPLQGLASVLGLIARDPVAGTGAGLLAATWGTIGVVTLVTPPGRREPALGVLLVAAAAAAAVPVVAGSSNPLAATVMGLSGARFGLTGISQLASAPVWQTVAGVAGVVLALVAGYAALAFELEGARGRPVVPVGRQSASAPEPGVRAGV